MLSAHKKEIKMPYLQTQDEEELKKQQESGPQNISGQSTVLNGTSAAPKGPQESGSFTNLNKYLEANKDNAAGMGAKIAHDVNQQGVVATEGIDQTLKDFNQQSDQGTIKNLDTAAQDADRVVNKARTSSYDNQVNDADYSRFSEVSNARYNGPQDFTSSQYHQDTQQKVNKANESKAAVHTDEGRFNLLQNAYARPTYSQGQKNLDNLLITGNQQAKEAIQTAGKGLEGIQKKYDDAFKASNNLAKQRTADSDLVRMQAQQGLASNRTARQGEVDQRLNDVNSQWGNEFNRLTGMLGGYKGGDLELSQADVNKLGLNGNGQGIYNTLNGIDPRSYMDLKAFDANKVVDKNEFGQLAALDKLAQTYGNVATSRFTDATQAGTLGLENNLDATGFGKAATGAEGNFQNTAANTNLDARGYNDQSWYGGGILNNDKHWVNAAGQAKGNVKDYLDNGNFTINGEQANYKQAGGADIVPANDIFNSVFGDALQSGIGWGGAGAAGVATQQAQLAANQQATQGYFKQLQDFLSQQGHGNRIKLKA